MDTWTKVFNNAANKRGPFFTCSQCWRFGPYSIFTSCACAPIKKHFKWSKLDAENRRRLIELWQTTEDQAEQYFKDARPHKLTKELATRKKEQLVEQGIEPNPGPQYESRKQQRNLKVLSLNTQSCSGAWRALDFASDFDICLFQDTPWTAADVDAFTKAARRRQFRVYWQPGKQAERGARRSGGVTTLVKQHRGQQQQVFSSGADTHTYLTAVHVQGLLVVNFYSPPDQSHHMAEKFHEFAVATKLHGYPWLAGGDANETPDDSCIASTLQQLEGRCLCTNRPTTWTGSREIDWYCSSRPQWCSQPQVHSGQQWSDHKAVSLQVACPKPCPQRFRYRPQPKWPKPSFLEDEEWSSLIQTAWKELVQQNPQDLQTHLSPFIEVDKEWNEFMCLLSKAYQLATRKAWYLANDEVKKCEVKAKFSQPGHNNGKGIRAPSLQCINNTIRPAGHLRADMGDRKLAKQLARLHEFKRLAQLAVRQAQAHQLQECSEQSCSLVKKIWPCTAPTTSLGHLLLQADADIFQKQADRRKHEKEMQTQRLQAWKAKMNKADVRSVSKWLHSKENPMTNVNLVANGQVADSNVSAAAMLFDHWQHVWHNQPVLNVPQAATELAQHFPAHGTPQPWSPPDLATFSKALLNSRGAAGTDSWSGDETKFLPVEVVQHVYQLTLRWHAASQVPSNFAFGRQCNLPKTHKIVQGCLPVSQTRPITVLSIWWRAYASAWCQTPQFAQFAQALPPEIAGVAQHEGCEEAACFLQQQFNVRRGILMSLDFSQCYDRMQIPLVTNFLQQVGWPPPLIAHMQSVWRCCRFLEFDGHVHPQSLISLGVPQGCPLAPLALACLMCSAHNSVNAQLQSQFGYTLAETQQADVRIYMDDRSWVDADLQRSLDRAEAWFTWSQTYGLQENIQKTQTIAKTKALQSRLQEARPAWFQPKTMTVLGVSIRASRAANTHKEAERVASALKRCHLLSTLPTGYARRLALFRAFVLPQAGFGWCCRFPPKKISNKIFQALSKVTQTNRMSNPLVRAVVYGGNTHLSVVLAVRSFKRICRMRQNQTVQWASAPGTPIMALRKWLRDSDWQEQGPWTWVSKDGERMTAPPSQDATFQAHQIRMAWRTHLLRSWANGTRHEAAEWRLQTSPLQMRAEIQHLDLEAVRRSFNTCDAYGRAVLLGSVVSPAWYGRAQQQDASCIWCGAFGSFHHIAWRCRRIPGVHNRPRQPHSWLESRLAWPSYQTSPASHRRVLTWLAWVQEQLLLHRYPAT
eukprot:Skav207430  [mRNA]  locus=scaffold1798:50686:54459:+ [translate_table: standard]